MENLNELASFGIGFKERVENALECLKNGKGVLVVDDENRENEGDLIFPAETMTVADMALMIRRCTGIVCLCLRPDRIEQLELKPMVEVNTSKFHTPFTVSIEARDGVTTGVSAADRMTFPDQDMYFRCAQILTVFWAEEAIQKAVLT